MKCEALHSGHILFFPLLENAISLSSYFQPAPRSPVSFTHQSHSPQSWLPASISIPWTLFLEWTFLTSKAVQCLLYSYYVCIPTCNTTQQFGGLFAYLFPFPSFLAQYLNSSLSNPGLHFVFSSGYVKILPSSTLNLSLFFAYVVSSDLNQISLSLIPVFASVLWDQRNSNSSHFSPTWHYAFLASHSLSSQPADLFHSLLSCLVLDPFSIFFSLWCQVPWELVQVLHSVSSASTSWLLRLMGAMDIPLMEEVIRSIRYFAHGRPREQLCTFAIAEFFFSPTWKTL